MAEEDKSERSNLRSAVSIRISALKRYIAEDDSLKVKQKSLELKETFCTFEEAHNKYHSSLKAASDIFASEEYFEEVQSKYVNVLTSVRAFLRAADESPVVPSASGAPPPCSQALRLPPAPQPQVFDGDPENFPMWKAAFATLIERKDLSLSGEQKMFYLQKYTTGEASNAIKSLFLIPSSESFNAAMDILKERFGSPSRVTSAFRRKLEAWPKISAKDPKALQSYSDFLQQIQVASAQYPSLSILDDEFENKKMVGKLPHHVSVKWVEIVVSQPEFPSFKTFADFVRTRAKISNHPLWDIEQFGSKAKTLATGGSEKPKKHPKDDPPKPEFKCCLCNNNEHSLSRCPKFTGMTLADRNSVVMKHWLCFGCLSRGHQIADCRNKNTCDVCGLKHSTLLHDHARKVTNLCTESDLPGTNCSTMVIPVTVSCKGGVSKVTYALLDSQSNTHFISDRLISSLATPSTDTVLELTTMSGKQRVPSKVVEDVSIAPVDGGKGLILKRCFSKSSIPYDKQAIPQQADIERWPHLQHVKLPNVGSVKVDLLIGYTCHQAFMPLEVKVGNHNEPFAVRTGLGWSVMGPLNPKGEKNNHLSLRTKCKEIILDEDVALSVEDRQFLKILDDGVSQRPDGKLSAPLPFRTEPHLPNNRFVALQRLEGLKKKFEKDSNYKDKYVSEIQESLDRGFAEAVPPHQGKEGSVWYIPHHGVPKDKNDVRVVFDCSAEYKGNNLNGILLQGPNLINTLIGIILRFRSSPVGLSCDIKKMYYNFFVNEEHRDLLRFLWWPGGDTSLSPVDYRMAVHLFGCLSSGGVASYCLRKISEWYGTSSPQCVKDFVEEDFYVDDGITSVESSAEASDLFSETQALLSKGGLKLHKVVSNSDEFLSSVSDEDKADDGDVHKVLGLEWNTSSDTLHVQLPEKLSKLTKRGMLSVVMSIFDPFGVAAPICLQARLLFQMVCDQSWDSPLPFEVSVKFQSWFDSLRYFNLFLPRCHKPDFPVKFMELHHFADASSTAYAACSYVRFVGFKGESHVSFVMGKCKVVPSKPVLTIPRLELIACVLATRLSQIISKELPWNCQEFFWTDSSVVLGYIRNTTSRFKVFVANRVQLIHNCSKVERWFHLPSEDNPADDGSRAKQSSRWLSGPDFLSHQDSLDSILERDSDAQGKPDKSTNPNDIPFEDSDQLEEFSVQCLLLQNSLSPSQIPTYRNWYSSIKVCAWALRFINNCKPSCHRLSGKLSLKELMSGEKMILKLAQNESFNDELRALKSHETVSKSSRLFKLCVFLDKDGLIRVGGRLKYSDLSFEAKHPAVIPPNSEVANMIIDHFHQRCHHQGRGITMSEVRSHGFWVIGLGHLVKRVIRSCVICQRLRGKPIEQKMADLPVDRLSPGPAFTGVACDCFGPFVVKNGRSCVKRYGLMFTCLASRAVHIEMVYTLSTDSFLNAFKRFTSVRGPVSLLRCDRGTNFVGAYHDLLKLGCQIEFNPPGSSHRGGVWERMIGVSRRVLEGILIEHGQQLDDESLLTLLSETAYIVNSRPLCSLSSDNSDLEPLTANQLLTMKSKVVSLPPICDDSQADLYAVRRWRRVQYLANLFWSRWRKEFLSQYHGRSKWFRSRENLKVNDIVLVVDEQRHRSFWKLARVVNVKNSLDGLVRSVSLVLADGSKIERAVQKLIFLMHS